MTRVWYCTHESELENGLHHADNARAHTSYMLCSTIYVSIQLTLMLINLRMQFELIAFVIKRIVPQG